MGVSTALRGVHSGLGRALGKPRGPLPPRGGATEANGRNHATTAAGGRRAGVQGREARRYPTDQV
jgi:hypothetical protein